MTPRVFRAVVWLSILLAGSALGDGSGRKVRGMNFAYSLAPDKG